jgi:hypothetical protein
LSRTPPRASDCDQLWRSASSCPIDWSYRLQGPYAVDLAILTFFNTVGPFGMDVYLVRWGQAPTAAMYNEALTLLLLSGIGIASTTCTVPPLPEIWFGDQRFIPSLLALLPALPIPLLSVPAIASLERDLNYRAVVMTSHNVAASGPASSSRNSCSERF